MRISRHSHSTWRRMFSRFLLVVAIPICGLTPLQGQSLEKKRIAILDFDNAAVQSSINTSSLQTEAPSFGRGVSQLLINKLVQDGNATVVERAALDKVLAEQNLTNSERADPKTAARLGKILGVDAIILGAITRYDYDENMKGYVGSKRGKRGTASPQAKYDVRAKVQISARLVSSDSAEIVAVSEGAGETSRNGVVMDVRDTAGRVMQAVGMNNPVVNESLDKAIAQLAAQLEPTLAKLPARSQELTGLVADVSESGQLVLNFGARQGVKVGDRLQVLRGGEEIRVPATSKVLTRNDAALGEAVVTAVNDISCIAQYHGTEKVKVRDVVKVIQKQP